MNCQRKEDELICPVNKSILERNMIEMDNNLVKMGIYFLSKKGEFIKFPLISNIYISIIILKKKSFMLK